MGHNEDGVPKSGRVFKPMKDTRTTMTKPMTLEELKEKALLTDKEMSQAIDSDNPDTIFKTWMGEEPIWKLVAKAQQEKDIQAFIQFCDNEHIYKVTDLIAIPLKYFKYFKPVAKVFGPVMVCRHCGSTASVDNKFYTLCCCKKCHDKGRE